MDNEVKSFLLETAQWAKFISIVGFVGVGFMVLGGLMLAGVGGGYFAIMVIIYLLMALIYFFPILYLYKAAVGLKNGINSNNQELFKDGVQNLKSHYKFIGILTTVVLSLYVLSIIFGLLGALMR
ncbi:MAG: hypothetical protein FJX30_06665 [Alphaproteobacteria bacterium]|nr:hypothetical protein [Bacteroidota bacterium]MBM3591029.1 hypothetical protein [Alphaproteobacteria bacterium]